MITLIGCTIPPDEPLSNVAWTSDEVPEWVDGPTGRVRVHYTAVGPDALDAALALHDTSLAAEWSGFAVSLLATGVRSGDSPFGPGASDLDGVTATAEGAAVHGTWGFPPLSARYFRIDHAGGPLMLAAAGVGEGGPPSDRGAMPPIMSSAERPNIR